ncbi:65-kDa microtubule-associated protein 3-like [Iris pallida]|uniref:65-kDa microtubule-associated protein 3-like n=1 Tax=Iris pallida TaxID=29817 RepID=A0AAX6IJS6_IRIPA|nr:65-kDa microtubule-associated protein 3-like [Iris pallida]
MVNLPTNQSSKVETACGTLLDELQNIWEEIGEPEAERDKMLHDLEQECLELYRKKVDLANRSRAQLRQTIAASEAELAAISSAMGEPPVHLKQNAGSLKEELKSIIPKLEEMKKRKAERLNQFLELIEQMQKISIEIGPSEFCSSTMFDESDLSLRRLEDLYGKLQSLQKEKCDRIKLVMDHLNTLNSLCDVLGIEFEHITCEVYSTLDARKGSEDVSNETIERLESAVHRLREVKIQRMHKLQDLATAMFEMWNLMDTPAEEQQKFQTITCNIAASEHEITEPNSLSEDFIKYVEAEVMRLEELKASKMKELVYKKKIELEELLRRTHLVEEQYNTIEAAIKNGAVDPSLVLEQIEIQISRIKDEAFSRKEILERVEKWLAACDEESWLEEYNRDENRYNAGRGTHLALKRAEKARAIVNKIPAMVEALTTKTALWENERDTEFKYDGVGLISMLEDYSILREDKEQERKRQRDQKRLQGQLVAEQEVLFGSKPSPSKNQSSKKMLRTLTMGPNRKQSLGGAALQTPKSTSTTRKEIQRCPLALVGEAKTLAR